MLKHIIAVIKCDACGEEANWIQGNETSKAWKYLDDIVSGIKYGNLSGWVRDWEIYNEPCHWCPKCHTKKPLAGRE